MHRLPRATIFVSAVLLACCAPAAGQSNELRLDDSGQWEQTDAPVPGTTESLLADARRALAEDRPGAARVILDPWIKANERSGDPLLPQALLLRGDALTALGDEYNALYDYERIIKEFTGTESFATAVERELNIGVNYVNGLERKFFGLRILNAEDIGEELLIRVQERMPGSRIAERAGIELADYYYRTRQLKLAAEAYDLFTQLYPRSQYATKAMERRIYSTIAMYKGPRYDGSPLLDSQVLVRRFASLYPAQAKAAGLDDALVARLDDSAADELLETARWYLRNDDEVSARFVLKRLLRERPRSAAAQDAYAFMIERKWIEPPRDPEPTPRPGATGEDEGPRRGRPLTRPAATSEPGTAGMPPTTEGTR